MIFGLLLIKYYDMKYKSITINAILNTTKTVLGVLFPLITFPYISRVLSVESLGEYNFASSIVSYFILFAGLGVANYAIREGTQYRENKKQIRDFISEVFSINIFSTVITYVFLFVIVIMVPYLHNYVTAILILSIQIFFNTIGVSWVCNIFEDFFYITVRTIMIQIVSLALIFLLVRTDSDLYVYIGIVTFSASAANIINYLYIRRKYCRFNFLFRCNFKRHLKPILTIFATSVAISVYVSSDTTMLGFLSSDYHVGLYAVSVKIYTIIKNIIAAALMVVVPRFSLYLKGDNLKEDANWLFGKAFDMLMIIMLPVGTGLFALSKDVVIVISGEKYINASTSLQLLSVAAIFSLFSYLFVQCLLIPSNRERTVLIATCVSAITNICLNFVFIPLWGVNGAAFTTIISEIIVLAITYIKSREIIAINIGVKGLLSVVLGCVCIRKRSIGSFHG